MLVFGTQMHIVTFLFVCIEIVLIFYLLIYALARPDDKVTRFNILLIFLLIAYNVIGGLLPDSNLPGSFFLQEVMAYATGFIIPCYFPYYVYRVFGLERMKFHAYKGVYLCLVLPYIAFIIVFALSGSLETAKKILALLFGYAIWVIYSLFRAIQYKYGNNLKSRESKEEVAVLFLSLTPWVGLPLIDYYNLGQAMDTALTNGGFLLLLALHFKRHIKGLRLEHERLLQWNATLQREVEKRTEQLERIHEQKTNAFINLAHEIKTPLTLIGNYLEEYIRHQGHSEELGIIQNNVDKLCRDISNFFDLERFNKDFVVYHHNQVANFSEMLTESLVLFEHYCLQKSIELKATIEDSVYVKADSIAIDRIINNLIENAIKYSPDGSEIHVSLQCLDNAIHFCVADNGPGIPPALHKKVFEPYYQIAGPKRNSQGMGLGLPIVKKVVEDLEGKIKINSDPGKQPGTSITVVLNKHHGTSDGQVLATAITKKVILPIAETIVADSTYDEQKKTILLVEDNPSMIQYLVKKLEALYNVYTAVNGQEALKKLKSYPRLPDLILSDIMMDRMDGYTLAKIISSETRYHHIPLLFLSAKSTKGDRLQGLRLGAIDFIQKPFSIQELLQKIESVLLYTGKQKEVVLRMAVSTLHTHENLSLNTASHFEQNCQRYHLTTREVEIARLIGGGSTYKEVAETLFISEKTVNKHVQNIFEKVRVSNKVELINKLAS